MSNLFQTLEYEAFRAGITPRTERSREWFMTKSKGHEEHQPQYVDERGSYSAQEPSV